MQTLNQILQAGLSFGGPDFYRDRVPGFIYSNLRKEFGKRPYQQDAFGRFVFYWNEYSARPKGVPIQLLFHMATGSGKTLIMAGLIIYLYERGYRNFLFFVNSSNIIEKTRDNFLNPLSSKYLFANHININGEQIRIREADNFQGVNSADINIVFSTTQGLHSRLNRPQENGLSYEDFEDGKIVMISDEAHHINAETKRGKELNKEEIESIVSWESTVSRLFSSNAANVLLEFTATMDVTNPEIEQKYKDKLIFDYPLREFRKDGYSKEVKVSQADMTPFERALQSVLLSQYRRKIFEKHRILIKPVILFKSKTIKESQSFFETFATGIRKLKAAQLEKIRNAGPDAVIRQAFDYLDKNNISLENLVEELKEDFSVEKLISVNSKNESDEKQLAINSLEDEKNEYRAVFAVDKLNEGWDVLNLFDIVRLYDTRDAKAGKPGKTTMAEAQLIGRGARYCPFKVSDGQPFYRRKYDEDILNEMRVCEELYYHSSYNPRYIQELNTALEEIGIKAPRTIERLSQLKSSFKESTFYKSGVLFLNERQKYGNEDIFGLTPSITECTYKIRLRTGYSQAVSAFDNRKNISRTVVSTGEEVCRLIDFGKHIIRKAINKLSFYEFSGLKQMFPHLKSVSEFIHSDKYLGKVKLDISGLPEQIHHLTPADKLDAAVRVLDEIAWQLRAGQVEYKGSRGFSAYMVRDIIKDKVLHFTLDENSDKEFGRSMTNPVETDYFLDLEQKEWYVFNDCYGTSEEKRLIKYVDKMYSRLKEKYDEIYLVRNERHFRIYNFEDGHPFEPDFVLFLTAKQSGRELHYQVFIEPKGEHLMLKDAWKEDFLLSLGEGFCPEQLWADKEYTVWGLPLFNEKVNQARFNKEFGKLL